MTAIGRDTRLRRFTEEDGAGLEDRRQAPE